MCGIGFIFGAELLAFTKVSYCHCETKLIYRSLLTGSGKYQTKNVLQLDIVEDAYAESKVGKAFAKGALYAETKYPPCYMYPPTVCHSVFGTRDPRV